MAFSMAGGGPSGPQMNVTPLIDVLLVLIIIFMVVVTQEKRTGLKAEIPQPPKGDSQKAQIDRTIVIQVIEGSGKIPELRINEQPASWETLQDQLHDIFKTRAEQVAFVRADDEVDFDWIAQVIDTARRAGVKRVGLLDKEYASVK
jgi:biopolymer transport protein ExbD